MRINFKKNNIWGKEKRRGRWTCVMHSTSKSLDSIKKKRKKRRKRKHSKNRPVSIHRYSERIYWMVPRSVTVKNIVIEKRLVFIIDHLNPFRWINKLVETSLNATISKYFLFPNRRLLFLFVFTIFLAIKRLFRFLCESQTKT